MPKRELSETEKALRLEQVVERKALAAFMRLSPARAEAASERVHMHIRLSADVERKNAWAPAPFASGLRVTRTIDARELPLAKATCDPGLGVGGEDGA